MDNINKRVILNFVVILMLVVVTGNLHKEVKQLKADQVALVELLDEQEELNQAIVDKLKAHLGGE